MISKCIHTQLEMCARTTKFESVGIHFDKFERRGRVNMLDAKQDFFSKNLDAKKDFCSNILGAKQDFYSNMSGAKQDFCSKNILDLLGARQTFVQTCWVQRKTFFQTLWM